MTWEKSVKLLGRSGSTVGTGLVKKLTKGFDQRSGHFPSVVIWLKIDQGRYRLTNVISVDCAETWGRPSNTRSRLSANGFNSNDHIYIPNNRTNAYMAETPGTRGEERTLRNVQGGTP